LLPDLLLFDGERMADAVARLKSKVVAQVIDQLRKREDRSRDVARSEEGEEQVQSQQSVRRLRSGNEYVCT
jgi:hypothetical protein